MIKYKTVFAIVIMNIFLISCDLFDKSKATSIAVPVTVFKAIKKNIPAELTFVGQTQSPQEVEIRSRVNGFLIKKMSTKAILQFSIT